MHQISVKPVFFSSLRRGLVFLCVLFAGISAFKAQGPFSYFEKRFGKSNLDFSQVVREFSDGSIYIGGYTDSISQNGIFDPSLSKLDAQGNWLWTKHYTSAENDYCFSMVKLPDNKLIMAGEFNAGAADGVDVLLIKTDSSGNLIWKKNFGGPGTQSIVSIDTSDDGNLIMVGYSDSANADNEVLLIKADTAGNVLWQRMYGGNAPDYGDYVVPLQGGYLVSAVTSSYGGGGTDAWILKLNAVGDTLWTRTSGDQFAGGCQGVSLLKNGDYLLFGEEEAFLGSWFNFFFVRYDANGNQLWKKNFGGAGSDAVFHVTEASDKGFYCTGYSNSYSQGPVNLIFFKTDSLANLQWKRVYGGPGVDIGYDMVPSLHGGLLITGTMTDSLLQNQYYLLHLDSMGYTSAEQTTFGKNSLYTVFPNPSNGFVTVHALSSNDIQSVLLSDCLGRTVHQQFCNAAKELVLDLSAFENGMYTLTVSGKYSSRSLRIVLQKN